MSDIATKEYVDKILAEHDMRYAALLENRIKHLEHGIAKQNQEIEQTCGKVLGYPWFKDDQKNFPGATEKDGVCVGEHVAETIVVELAKRHTEVLARIKRLEEAGVWQPIETAPTDMTWVIGYDAKDGEVGTIIFDLTGDVDDEDVHYEWTDGMRTWNPTHWMPLPEPPEAKEAKP